jgi:hypothetical protein
MKKVLYVIGAIVLLIVILALVAPRNFGLERQIVVNRPKAEVFELMKSLRFQDQWSVWGEMDPDMTTEYRGTDGTVGFVSAWEGNKDVGKGEQEIIHIVEGERVDFELRFKEPFESTSRAYLITEEVGENQTLVTWGMHGRMPVPMNIMLLFMNMEKALAADFERGLEQMKDLVESQAVPEAETMTPELEE